MTPALYYLPALLAACALVGVGVAHTESDDQDDMSVNLVITTHYPTCTAVFMHDRDGVSLQTELRPMPVLVSYTNEELRAGINLTYSMTASLADDLIPVLAGRAVVSAVASYSESDPPMLLANATGTIPPSDRCGDLLDSGELFRMVYDTVYVSSIASGDSGTTTSENVISWLRIRTIGSNAEALAFLKAHGVTVGPLISEPTPTRLGYLSAHDIPISLLAPLARVDGIVSAEELVELEFAPRPGSISQMVEGHPPISTGMPYFGADDLLVVSIIGVVGLGGGTVVFIMRARSGKQATAKRD